MKCQQIEMLLFWCIVMIGLGIIRGDPNFVLILTDDQDLLLNGMVPMTNTLELVANHGKTFQNAFVNSPICCPSRSTILTGKFPHNTGVVNNSIEGNCSSRIWQKQHEPRSVAAILQENKDYVTFYAGKYLNTYGENKVGGIKHIPRGYDWWIGLKGNSKYYNYSLSVNGSAVQFGDRYFTDLLSDYSMEFLEKKPLSRPFFMTIAPPAPHAPFTPAKRHKDAFSDAKVVKSPSFNHTSSHKHWLVGMPPKFLPQNITILHEIQRHRLQSLLAVDEMVRKIVLKLKDMEVLENTYIIFTSDNGFHIGQFAQPWDKRQPYDTDIRVPFIVSGPLVDPKTLESYPISMVDVAPTILDLAKVDIPSDMDGTSFKTRLLDEKTGKFDKHIFIEYWGEGKSSTVDDTCPWKYDDSVSECIPEQWCKCQDSKNNTYTCVLHMTDEHYFKLCEFNDQKHFLEAYNLTVDPYELENIAFKLNGKIMAKYQEIIRKFRKCQGNQCPLSHQNIALSKCPVK